MDKVYGEFTTSHDSVILGDYVTCNSNTHHIVGLCAVREGNLVVTRFVEFDTLGLVSQSKKITPTGNYTKFFPFDVKPLDDHSGYIVVGYAWKLDAAVPWICKLDNMGNVLSMKNLQYGGFFSRVEQLNNGNFVFVGSHIGSLVVATPFRNSFYVTTDKSFNLLNSQILPSQMVINKFDNFNDIIEVENNEVIIAGCYTIAGGSAMIVLRLNPMSGFLNWQSAPFVSTYTSPRIVVSTYTVYAVFNDIPVAVSSIIKFDKLTGAFYGGFNFEVSNRNGCLEEDLLIHEAIIQNLYNLNNGKLFISGKFLSIRSEMPFDLELKIDNSQIINGHVYESKQNFNDLTDFTSYKYQPISGATYNSIQTRSSTIQYNDTNFSTITYTTNNTGFLTPVLRQKTWLYSNSFSGVHGIHDVNFVKIPLGISNLYVNVLDDLFIPNIENTTFQIASLNLFSLNCMLNFPCNFQN